MDDISTIQSYFAYHPEILWLIAAGGMLVLEVTVIPGIGLFFAALGAGTTGALMAFGVLDVPDFYLQVAYFFAFTTVWAAILWVPLKKWGHKHKERFHNMAGTNATIEGTGLAAGRHGTVRWSGASMRARLAEGEGDLPAGTEVWVHAVEEGVLIVGSTRPDLSEEK